MIASEARSVLAHLCTAYDEQMPETTLAVWTDRLRKCRYEEALAAADDLIETQKGMPSVAELLRRVGERQKAARRAVAEPSLVSIDAAPSCPRCGHNDDSCGVQPPLTIDDRNLAFHCGRCRLLFDGSEREWMTYAEERRELVEIRSGL